LGDLPAGNLFCKTFFRSGLTHSFALSLTGHQ
jgi:hypothetical protein